MTFDLAAHIRAVRESLGMSQSELARRVGIDQGDLSRIETGRTDPRWSTVQQISKALDEVIAPAFPPTAKRPLSPETRARVRRTKAVLDPSSMPDGPIPVKR